MTILIPDTSLGEGGGGGGSGTGDSLDTQVLFNKEDAVSGDSTLTFIESTQTLNANNLQIADNTVIEGNLTVNGEVISINSTSLNIGDNHIYLNAEYLSETGRTGGIVVNIGATSTGDTITAKQFTAGVMATSNPTVVTDGNATFATNDIIQIAETTENNGIYEVLSYANPLLTIRGIGTTGIVETWTDNQFVTDTQTGTITKVNVSVMLSQSDGTWETATGNETPLTFGAFMQESGTVVDNELVIFDGTTGAKVQGGTGFLYDNSTLGGLFKKGRFGINQEYAGGGGSEILELNAYAEGKTEATSVQASYAFFNTRANTAGTQIGVNVNDGAGSFVSSTHIAFNFTSGGNPGIEVFDSTYELGMQYAADYSANFVARTLVDKGYVDGNVFGSSAKEIIYNKAGVLGGNVDFTFDDTGSRAILSLGMLGDGENHVFIISNGDTVLGAVPIVQAAFHTLGGSSHSAEWFQDGISNSNLNGVPKVHLRRARHTSGNHLVQDGDILGEFHFTGYDGSNYRTGVLLQALVDGTAAVNSMPSIFEISTTKSSENSPTLAFSIDSSQVAIFEEAAIYSSDLSGDYGARSLIDKGFADSTYIPGPGTVVDNRLATFDGTTGLIVQDDTTITAVGAVLAFDGPTSVITIDRSGDTKTGSSFPASDAFLHGRVAAGNGSIYLESQNINVSNLASRVIFRRSRVTNPVVGDGDLIGCLDFEGHDSTGYKLAASIVAEVDGTVASGDLPGKLLFSTTPSGSTTPVVNMTILEDGQINFGNDFKWFSSEMQISITRGGFQPPTFPDPNAVIHLTGSGLASADNSPNIYIDIDSNNNSETAIAKILMRRRSGNSALVDGDNIAAYEFGAFDGSTYGVTARVRGEVDGTPGSSGSGEMPGSLIFEVTAEGATLPTTALTIGEDKIATLEAIATYTGTPSFTLDNQLVNKKYVDDTHGAGDVEGPASSVDNRIVTFDGTTGLLIQDATDFTITGDAISSNITNAILRTTNDGTVSLESYLNGETTSSFTSRGRVSVGTGNATFYTETDDASLLRTGFFLSQTFGIEIEDANTELGMVYADDYSTTGSWSVAGTPRIIPDLAFIGTLISDFVEGPSSAVDNRIVTFDGTTGLLIQDGGDFTIDGGNIFNNTSPTFFNTQGQDFHIESFPSGENISNYNEFATLHVSTDGVELLYIEGTGTGTVAGEVAIGCQATGILLLDSVGGLGAAYAADYSTSGSWSVSGTPRTIPDLAFIGSLIAQEDFSSSDTQVIFNDSGSLVGNNGLTFDPLGGAGNDVYLLKIGPGPSSMATLLIDNESSTIANVTVPNADAGIHLLAGALNKADIYLDMRSNTASTSASLNLRKYHNNSGADWIVTDESVLGAANFFGYSGDSYDLGAKIDAVINGTPSLTSMPTDLRFSVTPAGSTSPSVSLTLKEDNSIQVHGGEIFSQGTALIINSYASGEDASNFTELTTVFLDSTDCSIGHVEGDGAGLVTGIKRLDINDTDMLVTDTLDSTGLKYFADYSGNFTDRSIVDKAYVDAGDDVDKRQAGGWSGTSATTASLGIKDLYRYTGTGADTTLTVSNAQTVTGTNAEPWFFDIKDEGGNAGTFPITVVTASQSIISVTAAVVGALFSSASNVNLRPGQWVIHTGFAHASYNGVFQVDSGIYAPSGTSYSIGVVTFIGTNTGTFQPQFEGGVTSLQITADYGSLSLYSSDDQIYTR